LRLENELIRYKQSLHNIKLSISQDINRSGKAFSHKVTTYQLF